MLLLALTLACTSGDPGDSKSDGGGGGDTDTDSGGGPLTPTDGDADGYYSVASGGDDCDDANVLVNPAAVEDCNGYDDDCDGTTDESGTTTIVFYGDGDADGYGDLYKKAAACAPPAGYVADSTDCDDEDATIHPDGQEVCDDGNVDEDCDDLVNSGDDSATGTITVYPDLDLDGYGDAARPTERCSAGGAYIDDDQDCDDADVLVHPGAKEECNGIDDDCNGALDDGGDTSTFYADDDGDGYGDAASTADACTAPPGYVSNATDCDDALSATHPGGIEVCDAADVDEDCDGKVDDDDTSTTSKSTWYHDADADGYGSGSASTTACDAPAGYGTDTTDCDDADPAISPAATEVCGGGDENCNALEDEADPGLVGATLYYLDADDDGYGTSATTAMACALPAGYVTNADDCDDGRLTVNPGAVEECGDTVDNDCDGTEAVCGLISGTVVLESLADATFDGEAAGDAAAYSIDFLGDANRDGNDDVIGGAPGNDEGGADAGKAYISYGEVTGANPFASVSVELVGSGAGEAAGWSVAGAGDTDGDGRDDAIIGAPKWSASTGVAYIVTSLYSTTLGRTSVDVTGEASGDVAGWSVAGAGDVNDDGSDDVLVGAPYNDDGGITAGKAYLLYGSLASAALSAADADFTGENAGDLAGAVVASAGDIDGDGTDDVVIAAPWSDGGGSYSGRVYLFTGSPTGALALSAADAILTGDSAGDLAGGSVCGQGDLNDDGNDDLLVGADSNDSGGTNAGAAYIAYGPFSGSVDLGSADVILSGETAADHAGFSVAMAGDVDDDGEEDVLVGAYGNDRGASNSGTAYLVYGPFTAGTLDLSLADAFLVSEEASAEAAYSLAGNADADANGQPDILIGAPYLDGGGADAGAAFLVYAGR